MYLRDTLIDCGGLEPAVFVQSRRYSVVYSIMFFRYSYMSHKADMNSNNDSLHYLWLVLCYFHNTLHFHSAVKYEYCKVFYVLPLKKFFITDNGTCDINKYIC